MTSKIVALNKLILSPRNVRKTNGEEDIESLAESIKSKGLLQNLVASEAPGGSGLYEIDAGGRRLRALQLLAQRKVIPRNHPVPVIVVPRDDATEASLAENLQKIAMNPADEVEAFQAIIERYADNGVVDRAEQVANLARRFGRDVRYVEQRLRLANLAPEILDALRDGTITLDAAKAYAAVSDRKLQLKVFAGQQKVGFEPHRVAAIRAAYAGKVYRKADKIVRFVGLETYLAAGGRIDVDLFMGSADEEVLLDTELVDRLAKDKAEGEADKIAQEAGFLAGVCTPLTSTYFVWPKTPQGCASGVYTSPKIADQDKAEAVAIVSLADDGSGLSLTGYHFPKAAASGAAPAGRTGETQIEQLARIRRQRIQNRAVRLAAAPTVNGTSLDGRTFWPASEDQWIQPVKELPDGNFAVALLVVVPKDEIESYLAAAERELDKEESDRNAPAPADVEEDDEAEAGEAEAPAEQPAPEPVG